MSASEGNKSEQAANAVTQIHAPLTPMEMLSRAVAQGAGIDTLEKLLALQERWEKNEARKAFDAAMAAARAEIPTIPKDRLVDFVGKTGMRTTYRHESLAGIAKIIDPILSRHSLYYRFETHSQPNEPISVTCILSHCAGHAVTNTLTGQRDQSGNKNDIQAIGSAVTYLQRYTLKAALGLAASDDDDGAAAGQSAVVSDAQADEIARLIAETKSDVTKFLKWYGVESIADLPAAQFDDALSLLKAKKGTANADPA